jgi:nucleoid DNA-binding protein
MYLSVGILITFFDKFEENVSVVNTYFHTPIQMANFTKKGIIQEVSDRLGITQTLSSKMFHLVLEIVTRELANANNVVVRDFGTFETKVAKGRPGRNPKNPDKMIPIPDRAVVKFMVGKALKEKVARTLPEIKARDGAV